MKNFNRMIAILLLLASTTNSAPLSRGNSFKPYVDSLLNQFRTQQMDAILFWNSVTLQAGANDYDQALIATPDQIGPTTTARAFAIIHGSMYDSVAVFSKGLKPMFKLNRLPDVHDVPKNPAISAAIMEAAYQTLCAMYPKQQQMFDGIRAAYLGSLQTNNKVNGAISRGIAVGQLVASTVLSNRQNDGSQARGAYTPNTLPGYHGPDPTHPNQGYLGASWGNVKPFVLRSGSQFRASDVVGKNPTSRRTYLNSITYKNDFNEVKSIGSRYSSVRTPEQTEIGIFWAYDGAPKLGVPPRLYNQVVRAIAIKQRNTLEQNALLFGLINYALADAGIACWDSKYFYALWRPVLGIRQGSTYTRADPNWLPLGAPSDNNGDNFTPGFPSYVSGHSTFGSAVFEVLRRFYKRDSMEFEFQSDEYNGQTIDSITGLARRKKTRRYTSITQAETENYLSRIYLGVHWRIDQEQGRTMGRSVGSYVYDKLT